MLRMDIKTRYKFLTRKRWTLMGSLAGHVEGAELTDTPTAIRTMEELSEVSMTLDQLADELHSVTDQLSQLKSLRDVHSASALSMALRKLNTSFLKQVAETNMLRQQISSLEAERDEAWKQAQDVAQDFDNLNDAMLDTANSEQPAPPIKLSNSRRSSRIMAVRKSSIRISKAGLRSASTQRSQRSSVGSQRASLSMASSSAAKSTFSTQDIPPVPPIPRNTPLGIDTSGLPSRSSMGISPGFNTSSSDARALAQAQKELYDMLGITINDTKNDSRSRPRSLSGPGSPKHTSLNQRPMSDMSAGPIRSPSLLGNRRSRLFPSVITDDVSFVTISYFLRGICLKCNFCSVKPCLPHWI
ncbi:hypothetical protein SERLA73DRAFT_179444 [Serpula lacrymans var. lacrymans S7.3]|uniref:Uncharacterized protein n=1 Tax=Serpula lacrymans var. lacrymans (strain S7.3) TaxID=936435 RepID=F8PSG3_SERL3|nr:hypothetical protein SERLA73DRAFT_179444 [Serpula lacrymans var. lacrymans S7.3]